MKDDIFIFLIFTIILILIALFHFITFFLSKSTELSDFYASFYLSPLFNFTIGPSCETKTQIIFHTWPGRKKSLKTVDEAKIQKINGMYFCYDNTYTYKDLLYNGQIIKKEEQCNDVYPKDCGTIDTLNQHLCIKNTEKCPLYDVGIGESTDLTSYNYLGYPTELYYNKDGFNYPDKKIIGHLILNDGKPCYGPNEKLWKKFISKEKGKERLKCEMEVFDKLSDDRFKNKGDITYDQIYKDNLSGESYNLLKDELKDNKVSLYMKEFIGIDKTCDEKSNIKIDDYDKLKKNQEMEIKCSISEGSLLFSYSLAILIIIISKRNYSLQYILEQIICYLIIYFLATFIFFICHCVFLGRMIYYNKLYDCSDEITNEIFKILNKDAKNYNHICSY